MAFNQPLDADRVDGDGFISSFVLTTLMWVLDGLLAKDMAEKENQFLEEDSIFEEDSTKDIVNQDKDEAPPSHRDNIVNQSELNRANSIMPSSLNRNDTDMIALHILPTISESSEEENPSQFVRKNSRRKISWADSKSGQSLDNHYYQDEDQQPIMISMPL